jgi:anaerobic dimethyl sulfoxide reductase subunit C
MNLREWALPGYTILIQLATGMFFVLWIIRTFSRTEENEKDLDELAKIPILIIFFTILIAIIGSHFHLSRPLMSFLAVSNFRTSWLSREALFTLLLLINTAFLSFKLWISKASFQLISTLGWVSIILGVITLWCMTSVYLLPAQIAWNISTIQISSYGTALLLGVFSLFVIFLMDIRFYLTRDVAGAERKIKIVNKSLLGIVITAVVAAILVIIADLYQISILQEIKLEPALTSLSLLLGIYKPLLILRFSLLVLGLGCFVIYSFRTLLGKQNLNDMIELVYLFCLFILVGEIIDRFLFYATHVRTGI